MAILNSRSALESHHSSRSEGTTRLHTCTSTKTLPAAPLNVCLLLQAVDAMTGARQTFSVRDLRNKRRLIAYYGNKVPLCPITRIDLIYFEDARVF